MYLGHLYTVPLCTRFDRNESGSSLGVNRLIPYAEDQRVRALRTALFRLRVKQNMSLEAGFCHSGSSRGTRTHVLPATPLGAGSASQCPDVVKMNHSLHSPSNLGKNIMVLT